VAVLVTVNECSRSVYTVRSVGHERLSVNVFCVVSVITCEKLNRGSASVTRWSPVRVSVHAIVVGALSTLPRNASWPAGTVEVAVAVAVFVVAEASVWLTE
jgi:hypothetical protein